jgi:hypothetical protein
MAQEQILDPGKLKEKFNAKNKPLTQRMSVLEVKELITKAKIKVP